MKFQSKIQPFQTEAANAITDANIYRTIRETLVAARTKVYTAVNSAMVEAYWDIGRQIAEAVGDRAEYGQQLMQYLSERLTGKFGKGFTVRNLQAMRQFFQTFPIAHAVRADKENLFASKYRLYLPTEDELKREIQRERCLIERMLIEKAEGDK
jgi:hypothetical protein